jgi:tRNA A-37 threonylcarbamoyl transferase component Bud32
MVPAMQVVTGPGCVVDGRYELLDRIGQGAMGTIWRARDLVLTRDVAVKEVRLPDLMSDHDRAVLRERTLREARVSARLNHPGVVTVYDVIEADGTPWIVMELVAARSLDQALAEDGPLPPRRAAETGLMLLRALASAHAVGIVHRDVKPGNVLLSHDGRAVLTDFGIAAVDGDPALTQTGMVMGTPGFCAPERIRGEPASPASDLWSLGATLYAAVEGRGPFDGHGSPMAVLASIVHSDPLPARAAGPLADVIGALLSKNPARRPDAARAGRMLADAAAAPGVITGIGAVPVSAGAVPAPPRNGPASASAGPARASAQTDPIGFPASSAPAASSAGPGPATFPPGTGRGGFQAGPPSAQFADGTGTAQFLVGTSPDFLLPGTGRALFPAAPLPVTIGAAPLPACAGAGPAGRSGGRLPPGRRLLGLGLAGAAIVVAGLAAGLGWPRVTGPPVHSPPGRAAGAGNTSSGNTGSGAPIAGAPLPTGYRWYTRPGAPVGTVPGFTVAVPAGWQARQQGTTTYLRNPASGAVISVSLAPAAVGGPVREARTLELAALGRGSFAGYRRIAITPFLLRGRLAGAWRFAYRQPGAGAMDGLVVVTPGAVGARQPYELMATAPAASWPHTRIAFTEAVRTFRARR